MNYLRFSQTYSLTFLRIARASKRRIWDSEFCRDGADIVLKIISGYRFLLLCKSLIKKFAKVFRELTKKFLLKKTVF